MPEKIGMALTPFLWGGVLALVLNIPLTAVETHLQKLPARFRRAAALALVVFGLVALLALGLWLLIPQLLAAATDLTYSLPQLAAQLAGLADGAWSGRILSISEVGTGGLAHFWQLGMETLHTAADTAGQLVVAFILALYLLGAKESLREKANMAGRAFFGAERTERLGRLAARAMKVFSGFIAGQCIEACILAGMFVLALLIFRMPYVLPISAVIGVTALVPVFGAWVGCAVGCVLILPFGIEKTACFAILFFVVQQMENNLIYPRVVGSRIGLPPLWVLAAVILGGGLFGAAGLIFGIPAMSVLYHVGGEWIRDRNERTQKQANGLDTK